MENKKIQRWKNCCLVIFMFTSKGIFRCNFFCVPGILNWYQNDKKICNLWWNFLLLNLTIFFYLNCRHKRKVQNFLPCKTPTRGPLSNPGVPGGHSVTYEDPDMHLGHHRPLVMRHQLNVEVSNSKTIYT